jgi:hypothetical protein
MSRSLIFPSAPPTDITQRTVCFNITQQQRRYIINVCRSSCNASVNFVRLHPPSEYIDKLQYNSQIRNFMKLRPMWIVLFRADRWTDLQIWQGRNPDGGVTGREWGFGGTCYLCLAPTDNWVQIDTEVTKLQNVVGPYKQVARSMASQISGKRRL